MSLLPQGPLHVPGLRSPRIANRRAKWAATTTTTCRSTSDRLGLLIADVAGKGTSAALYMAELKGLMLSLSQLHASPRELLIDANRIISKHLDTRSFITMTYAVVDLRAQHAHLRARRTLSADLRARACTRRRARRRSWCPTAWSSACRSTMAQRSSGCSKK